MIKLNKKVIDNIGRRCVFSPNYIGGTFWQVSRELLNKKETNKIIKKSNNFFTSQETEEKIKGLFPSQEDIYPIKKTKLLFEIDNTIARIFEVKNSKEKKRFININEDFVQVFMKQGRFFTGKEHSPVFSENKKIILMPFHLDSEKSMKDEIKNYFSLFIEERKEDKKPAIKIIPELVWLEKRRDDLCDAVKRKQDNNEEVPDKWKEQIKQITCELIRMEDK